MVKVRGIVSILEDGWSRLTPVPAEDIDAIQQLAQSCPLARRRARLAGQSFCHVCDDVPDSLWTERRVEGRHQISSFDQHTRHEDGVGSRLQGGPPPCPPSPFDPWQAPQTDSNTARPLATLATAFTAADGCGVTTVRAWGVRWSQVSLE